MNGKIIEFDKNSSSQRKVRRLRQSTAAAYRRRRGKSSFIGIRRDYSFMLLRAPPSLPSPHKRRRPVFALASFDSHFAPVSTVSKQVFKPASERAAALKACLSKL